MYIYVCEYTPTQAESLLHGIKQEASGIGLYENSDRTEPEHFKEQSSEIKRPFHISRLLKRKYCLYQFCAHT